MTKAHNNPPKTRSLTGHKSMKTTALITAGILGTAIASQAAVILSDNFDGRTITGGTSIVGNVMHLGSGWDVDLTNSASSLTSAVTGWSPADGTQTSLDSGYRAKTFSFTFTPTESYSLSKISLLMGDANAGGGHKRNGTSNNTVTISHAGGTLFTDTVQYTTPNGGYVAVDYNIATAPVLATGIEYTFTNSTDTANMPDYNLIQLEGVAVPEPSSAALLGLGGLALILRRRK